MKVNRIRKSKIKKQRLITGNPRYLQKVLKPKELKKRKKRGNKKKSRRQNKTNINRKTVKNPRAAKK
jgi:hypothetical protein